MAACLPEPRSYAPARRRIAGSYAAGILLVLITTGACSLPFLPERNEVIRGEHSIVVMNDPGVSKEQYEDLRDRIDRAYEDLSLLMGLSPSFTVSATCDSFRNDVVNPGGTPHVIGGFVFFTGEFFNYRPAKRSAIIIHELAHLFLDRYFGQTDMFILSEGAATWFENYARPAGPQVITEGVAGLLSLTYASYAHDRVLYESRYRTDDYYDMGRAIVQYWCETYGLDSFFALYREISSVSFRETIERHAGMSYEDLVSNIEAFLRSR